MLSVFKDYIQLNKQEILLYKIPCDLNKISLIFLPRLSEKKKALILQNVTYFLCKFFQSHIHTINTISILHYLTVILHFYSDNKINIATWGNCNCSPTKTMVFLFAFISISDPIQNEMARSLPSTTTYFYAAPKVD